MVVCTVLRVTARAPPSASHTSATLTLPRSQTMSMTSSCAAESGLCFGTFFPPPINPDGSSIFKTGTTIPVKFKLTGASAAVGDLTARLSVTKISAGVSGTELEATTNAAADGGDAFRYDAAAGQYIYNLSTKSLSAGTWSLKADLGDGVTHQINVSLKGAK